MASPELHDNAASESDHTSYDSDQVEEFDSEEEFSRVLPTPRANRHEPRVNNSSTPRATRNAPWNRAAGSQQAGAQIQTQHTQQLAPLTGTQLRALMEENEATHDGSDDETRANETASQPLEILKNVIGDETDGKLDDDDAINTDGVVPADQEDEHILSSDDEPTGNADVTPVNPGSTDAGESQKARLGNGSLLRRSGDGKGGGAYIDETPLKMLSIPRPLASYVYLIVKWDKDPNWWPVRAEKRDWEAKRSRATVTFRLNQSGIVDLAASASEFELRKGDKVHVYGTGQRNVEYTVKELKNSSSAAEDAITTVDGYNRVVLEARRLAKTTKSRSRSVVKAVEVDVSDIYLTNKDMDSWCTSHNIPGLPPKSPVTPKRTRHMREEEDTEQESTRRRSVDTTRLVSPRKRRQIEGSPKRRTARIDSDGVSPAISPTVSPSRLRVSTGRYADSSPASEPQTRGSSALFAGALFTVSISSATRETLPATARLHELVQAHGGGLLEEGVSQKVRLSEMDDEDGCMPDLECDFGTATFAAVLADKPRRTLKYLEMLALGWPCLHYQYLQDCIDRGELLDWRPYTLPAGDINLSRRKMTVSFDVGEFYRRWLHGSLLNEQFRKRRIALQCSVPICVLKSKRSETESKKWMLVTMSAPLYRTWFYSDASSIPEGSLVLELERMSESQTPDTDPEMLFQMRNFAAADRTINKDLEWFVQCLINGSLV